MKPLHEELKEIRLKKGVSLEDIYKATRIRMHLLEALEEGNFTVLPLPYIRAFLREYAKEIGMDSEYVIARFEKKSSTIQDEKQGQEEKTSEEETVSQESDSAAIEEIPARRKKTKRRKKSDKLNDQKESPVEHSPEVDKASVGKDESDAAEETLPDTTESSGIDTATSEGNEPEEITQPSETEGTQTPVHSGHDTPGEQAAAKEDLQTSLFNGTQETASDSSSDNDTEEKTAETVLDESSVEQAPRTIIDDSIEELTIEKPVLPDSSTERKRLKIDEPNYNVLFFIIFLILIIIAAGIIVVIR
ncbi:MAG: hypothetical protein HOC71_19460 [Candidatus Latescibacteria bacterium]|jgi:hypothetical protein|nr:hypothetical protein [Candidatus Latescibacterota bacterium]